MRSTKVLQLHPVNRTKNIDISVINIRTEEKVAYIHSILVYEHKTITVHNHKSVDIVPISSVLYIQSSSNYSTIYLEGGKSIVTSKTLKYWQQKINDARFLRSHTSFLVNSKYVKSIDKKNNSMVVGINKVLVSRSRKIEILSYFE